MRATDVMRVSERQRALAGAFGLGAPPAAPAPAPAPAAAPGPGPSIPRADAFPRGAVVLSTVGEAASSLRWSVFWIAILLLGAGFGLGWLVKGAKVK